MDEEFARRTEREERAKNWTLSYGQSRVWNKRLAERLISQEVSDEGIGE